MDAFRERRWNTTKKMIFLSCVGVAIALVSVGASQYGMFAPVRSLSEEEGEHEHEYDCLVSESIMCVVFLLVIITICFEKTKEYVEEATDHDMEPIITSLFGELTVLGFLSMFTFVFTQSGVFKNISIKLFGEEEEELVLEIFEYVHYTLFIIMVCFIAQVLVLIKQAMQIEKQWLDMECSRDDELIKKMRQSLEERNATIHNCASCHLTDLPMVRNMKANRIEKQLQFYDLREEFLKERSLQPPFTSLEPKKRLNDDFNFARYLSICLGRSLAKMVHVNTITWLFVALVAILFHVLFVVSNENIIIFSCAWAIMGWLLFLFDAFFEWHLNAICQSFIDSSNYHLPKELLIGDTGNVDGDDYVIMSETSESCAKSEKLPLWCKIDLDAYMARRSIFARKFGGTHMPNRQHVLYWFERHGPEVHMNILQMNLVFTSIYSALLLLLFLPMMSEECEKTPFIFFLIFSVIPMVITFLNKKHLVATLSQVGCMGTFRKHDVVMLVMREQKTLQAINSFITLFKLHHSVKKKGAHPSDTQCLNQRNLEEASKIFDLYDKNGDGTICHDDFQLMMEALKGMDDDQSIKNVIEMLDISGDGKVCKREFLDWFSFAIDDDSFTLKEKARFLFRLFDKDNTGAISMSEIKSTLDSMNLGFTLDEIGDLFRELDKNNNGVVCEEEFKELIEKHQKYRRTDKGLI